MDLRRDELIAASVLLCFLLTLTLASPPRAHQPQTRPVVVDINTASRGRLTALPGVGPSTAEAIVAARPYGSVDELRRVVGARRFERVRPYVRVSD